MSRITIDELVGTARISNLGIEFLPSFDASGSGDGMVVKHRLRISRVLNLIDQNGNFTYQGGPARVATVEFGPFPDETVVELTYSQFVKLGRPTTISKRESAHYT